MELYRITSNNDTSNTGTIKATDSRPTEGQSSIQGLEPRLRLR